MYFDGSLIWRGTGVELVVVSPLKVHMKYTIRLYFPTSNNVVEYEAPINGIKIVIELGIQQLEIRGDSQLIVDQVMKESSCHGDVMAKYYHEVCKLENNFHGLELKKVLRRLKEATNLLAKMASSRKPVPSGIFASN